MCVPANEGDGFGVGWYDSVPDPELGQEPCIFTSVTPAWNNINLHRIAEKIKSPLVLCVFADSGHVRASTAGALSETNCHPWRYGRLMWCVAAYQDCLLYTSDAADE